MSESRLWEYLRTGMGARWEAQRHEDRFTPGIPDVSYSITRHGWIELKYLPTKPKKSSSILKIDHYTQDQRNWAIRHGRRAGLCFMLLQVNKTYMLFDWTKATLIGSTDFETHKRLALGVWESKIDWRHLRSLLVSPVVREQISVFRSTSP